jgi:hypothetical protein
MDRRTFLARASTTAAAAGWAIGAAGIGASRADAQPGPHRPDPVVGWELVGGFLAPGFAALRPARLVAYPDGLAIADADRQLRLSRAELGSLRMHAVRVLGNRVNGRRRPGAPVIADAPATRFQVRAAAGTTYTIQADALEESRADRAYPNPLYELLDHLAVVRRRVVNDGRPYRREAVRLIAVVVDPPPATVNAWPTGVRVPAISATAGYGQLDLHGAPAYAAVRAIPRRDPWQWPTYRTGDGQVLQCAWRYLLPHE